MESTKQTSNFIYDVIEDIILEPKNNTLLIEYLSKTDDGIFTAPINWYNFAHKVDKNGGAGVIDYFIGRKKLSGNVYNFTLERDNWYESECTLKFNTPIKMVVGGYRKGGEWINIIESVDFIKGEISYEWLFGRGERKASSIEIYIEISDFGKNE